MAKSIYFGENRGRLRPRCRFRIRRCIWRRPGSRPLQYWEETTKKGPAQSFRRLGRAVLAQECRFLLIYDIMVYVQLTAAVFHILPPRACTDRQEKRTQYVCLYTGNGRRDRGRERGAGCRRHRLQHPGDRGNGFPPVHDRTGQAGPGLYLYLSAGGSDRPLRLSVQR